ncbi:hypothetical protein MAR_012694, partial [Mya arenaria]
MEETLTGSGEEGAPTLVLSSSTPGIDINDLQSLLTAGSVTTNTAVTSLDVSIKLSNATRLSKITLTAENVKTEDFTISSVPPQPLKTKKSKGTANVITLRDLVVKGCLKPSEITTSTATTTPSSAHVCDDDEMDQSVQPNDMDIEINGEAKSSIEVENLVNESGATSLSVTPVDDKVTPVKIEGGFSIRPPGDKAVKAVKIDLVPRTGSPSVEISGIVPKACEKITTTTSIPTTPSASVCDDNEMDQPLPSEDMEIEINSNAKSPEEVYDLVNKNGAPLSETPVDGKVAINVSPKFMKDIDDQPGSGNIEDILNGEQWTSSSSGSSEEVGFTITPTEGFYLAGLELSLNGNVKTANIGIQFEGFDEITEQTTEMNQEGLQTLTIPGIPDYKLTLISIVITHQPVCDDDEMDQPVQPNDMDIEINGEAKSSIEVENLVNESGATTLSVTPVDDKVVIKVSRKSQADIDE